MEGKLIIFSAPSGSGKTTIVQHLLASNKNLGFSISACTREKRSTAEENGKDYHFLTPEEFKHNIETNAFAEWEEVYGGAFYGTLKSEIERIWAEGKHVIFDVDVKGGIKLKETYGDNALSIFVKIPSMEILESRLRYRNTESEENIQKRLSKARFEMDFQSKFDNILVNEILEDALVEAEKIVNVFIG